MNSQGEELSSILNFAQDLIKLGRYHDAIPLLSRVIQTEPINESQISDKWDLADCHAQSGSLSRALAELAELYILIKNNPNYLEFGCRLFARQIYMLFLIYETMGINDRSCLNRLFHMIENGLNHLHEIGKENMRYDLLLYRSIISLSIGDNEHALIDAEESYRLAKDDIRNIIQLAKCAFNNGDYRYGVQMLNNLSGRHMDSLLKTQYLTIYVKLLLKIKPVEITEALYCSKELIILADKIQATDDRIFAYSAAAQIAIASESYKDASTLIKQIESLSTNNTSFARPYYLSIALTEIILLLDNLNKDCIELKNYIILAKDSIHKELIIERNGPSNSRPHDPLFPYSQ